MTEKPTQASATTVTDAQQSQPIFDSRARTQLSISLLLLRIGVAAMMLIWTIDKFVDPGHAAAVFQKFYKIPGLDATMAYVTGGLQLIVVIAFLFGLFRTWSYGLVLLMHGVSTFSSWEKYVYPWADGKNLLFFAAIPALSACVTLFLLRRFDAYSLDACWLAKPVEA